MERPLKMARRLAGTALISWLVAGCAEGETESLPPLETPDSVPGIEAAPSPMDTMIQRTMALKELNDSGVSGEAMAMHADDAVVVILELESLPGVGQYAAHVHQGTCADGGPVLAPLNPVPGLADGTGTSTTTLDVDELGEPASHFIMVHGEGGTPVACGDMDGLDGDMGR